MSTKSRYKQIRIRTTSLCDYAKGSEVMQFSELFFSPGNVCVLKTVSWKKFNPISIATGSRSTLFAVVEIGYVEASKIISVLTYPFELTDDCNEKFG